VASLISGILYRHLREERSCPKLFLTRLAQSSRRFGPEFLAVTKVGRADWNTSLLRKRIRIAAVMDTDLRQADKAADDMRASCFNGLIKFDIIYIMRNAGTFIAVAQVSVSEVLWTDVSSPIHSSPEQ
jgi:hypothetical protein